MTEPPASSAASSRTRFRPRSSTRTPSSSPFTTSRRRRRCTCCVSRGGISPRSTTRARRRRAAARPAARRRGRARAARRPRRLPHRGQQRRERRPVGLPPAPPPARRPPPRLAAGMSPVPRIARPAATLALAPRFAPARSRAAADPRTAIVELGSRRTIAPALELAGSARRRPGARRARSASACSARDLLERLGREREAAEAYAWRCSGSAGLGPGRACAWRRSRSASGTPRSPPGWSPRCSRTTPGSARDAGARAAPPRPRRGRRLPPARRPAARAAAAARRGASRPGAGRMLAPRGPRPTRARGLFRDLLEEDSRMRWPGRPRRGSAELPLAREPRAPRLVGLAAYRHREFARRAAPDRRRRRAGARAGSTARAREIGYAAARCAFWLGRHARPRGASRSLAEHAPAARRARARTRSQLARCRGARRPRRGGARVAPAGDDADPNGEFAGAALLGALRIEFLEGDDERGAGRCSAGSPRAPPSAPPPRARALFFAVHDLERGRPARVASAARPRGPHRRGRRRGDRLLARPARRSARQRAPPPSSATSRSSPRAPTTRWRAPRAGVSTLRRSWPIAGAARANWWASPTRALSTPRRSSADRPTPRPSAPACAEWRSSPAGATARSGSAGARRRSANGRSGGANGAGPRSCWSRSVCSPDAPGTVARQFPASDDGSPSPAPARSRARRRRRGAASPSPRRSSSAGRARCRSTGRARSSPGCSTRSLGPADSRPGCRARGRSGAARRASCARRADSTRGRSPRRRRAAWPSSPCRPPSGSPASCGGIASSAPSISTTPAVSVPLAAAYLAELSGQFPDVAPGGPGGLQRRRGPGRPLAALLPHRRARGVPGQDRLPGDQGLRRAGPREPGRLSGALPRLAAPDRARACPATLVRRSRLDLT